MNKFPVLIICNFIVLFSYMYAYINNTYVSLKHILKWEINKKLFYKLN